MEEIKVEIENTKKSLSSAEEVKAKIDKMLEGILPSRRSLLSGRKPRETTPCADFAKGVKEFTRKLDNNPADPNTAALGIKLATETESEC